MSDPAVFLRARLGEDEHWAHMAEAGWPPENALAASGDPAHYPFMATDITPSKATFIRRHSPARVLREIEAIRRILDDLPAYSRQRRDLRDHVYLPENASYHSGHADGTDDAALWVLRQLATIYSDHPDYDPAWNPETAKAPPGVNLGGLPRDRYEATSSAG